MLLQADLIGKGKETATDRKMRQLLHRQWADAQDDKELAQVMRGLKNGFRRRHGAGFLDDDVSRLLAGVCCGDVRLWCSTVVWRCAVATAALLCRNQALPCLRLTAFHCMYLCHEQQHTLQLLPAAPTCLLCLQEDEMGGRRRRARIDGEEEGEGGAAGLWPSPFGDVAGSDDEAEDEDLLRKAKQGLLLAESQELLGGGGGGSLGRGGGSGGIPLDEGSQEVLGLLARSSGGGSELQGGGSGPLPRSRFAPPGALATFGSDPSNSRLPAGPGAGPVSAAPGASGVSRGPSFVGRQPTVQRMASNNGLGGGGGRSFVFGRDDSNGACVPDKVRGRGACPVLRPAWLAPAAGATANHHLCLRCLPRLTCCCECESLCKRRWPRAARRLQLRQRVPRRGPPVLPTCAKWQACRYPVGSSRRSVPAAAW